jgi:hypothetical protein
MRFLARVVGIAATFLLTLQLSAQNPNNPIQIALLRWYQADTAAVIPMQSTCISPQGEVFDGAHIWVSCTGSAPPELEEYNASDAAFIQKVTLASAANYLLYDGANVWAASPVAGKVTEVQASAGTVLGTVTVGTPSGMAFDGQYIWVTSTASNNIVQIQALTRTVTNTFPVSGGSYDCSGPTSIASISSPTPSIWVVCSQQSGGNTPQVMELSSAGALVNKTAFNAIGGTPGCHNIAFDGQNIWLPTSSGPGSTISAVLEISTSTLSVTPIAMPANSDPLAVAYDGEYIWVALGNGNVTKVLQSTGSVIDTAASGGAATYFLAFDGGYVWASLPDPVAGVYSIAKM